MRIVDATARLIRAPEVRFAAAEIGLDAFGHNIENRHLLAALDARARNARVAHADRGRSPRGRNRRRRRDRFAQGRRPHRRPPRHRRRRTALALPHRRRHRERWPRLSADRADLQSRAHPAAPRHLDRIPHRERAVHAGAAARRAVEPRLRGRARRGRADRRARRRRRSTTRSSGARIRSSARSRSSRAAACFRSRSRPCGRLAQNRIALVGEAAHLIPPIGAQGLNLGLRDAACIGELVVSARRDGGDVGAPICWRATTRSAAPT